MTTRDTVTAYLDRLRQHRDWASTLADDITFTSYTSPVRRLSGKAVFREPCTRTAAGSALGRAQRIGDVCHVGGKLLVRAHRTPQRDNDEDRDDDHEQDVKRHDDTHRAEEGRRELRTLGHGPFGIRVVQPNITRRRVVDRA